MNAWMMRNGRPRFRAARLQHQRSLERQWPEPTTSGRRRVARQDDAERLGARIKTERVPAVLAETGVQHREIEPARSPRSTVRISFITPAILLMFRRDHDFGIPVVADSCWT